MLAVASANGALGCGAKPWHAKISFTLNDWDGKRQSEGTLEEYWASPEKIRFVYATSSFNMVEYITPSGIRRTGIRDGAPPELTQIIDQFLRPVSFVSDSAKTMKLDAHQVTLGTTKLSCITAENSSDALGKATYCASEPEPVLRLILGPGGFQRTIRNSILKFQDHYFPRNVERDLVAPGEKTGTKLFTANLENLEFLNSVNDAQFTPPDNALRPPQVVTLDEKTTKPQLLQHAPPVYPPIARAARVSGDVVISLQIQTDGHVARLHVLRGPPMLQQASLAAVKKWTYKPFEKDGDTVEVNTNVTVQFRLLP